MLFYFLLKTSKLNLTLFIKNEQTEPNLIYRFFTIKNEQTESNLIYRFYLLLKTSKTYHNIIYRFYHSY